MKRILKIQPVTSGYRPIRNGQEYDRYFPKARMTERQVVGSREADVEDVVRWMQAVVRKWYKDTEAIAPRLKGENLQATVVNIWAFLYHHIQYKLDTAGLEELRRPARSWADRKTGVDCDDFAMAASSILTVLEIPHAFRITRYEAPHFQHVYVVVPHERGYYKIDPVLSRANYEKPFNEKADFMNTTPSIHGINVSVLEGIGNRQSVDEYIRELLFKDNLQGAENPPGTAPHVYQYLIATRQQVAQNPQHIALIESPEEFIRLLDYAIKYWNTPKRDEALDVLTEIENELNLFNGREGIAGFEDYNDDIDWSELEGMSTQQIRQYLSEIQLKGGSALGKLFKRRRRRNPKGRKRSFFNTLKTGLRNGVKSVVKFNPLVIAARNGFLLAMKINLYKIAERVKWGYATPLQAKGKVSAHYHQQARKAVQMIEDRFVKRLGGKRSALRNAILKGKSGGLSGAGSTDFAFGLAGGLGEPVTMATLIASASTVIAWAASTVKKLGLTQNGDPSPAVIQKALQRSQVTSSQAPSAPEQEKQTANHIMRHEPRKEAQTKPHAESNSQNTMPEELPQQRESTAPSSEASENNPNPAPKPKGKLAEFYEKNKVLVWLGGSLLTLGGAFGIGKALTKKTKQVEQVRPPMRQGISGTGRHKKAPARKPSTSRDVKIIRLE